MFKIISLLFIFSCTTQNSLRAPYSDDHKDFSPRELITTAQMLTKVYDEQIPPLKCVSSPESAELLLRTLKPRLDIVIDDIESILDQNVEVNSLVNNCMSDCTCEFIDEIFREHQITLTKEQTVVLQKGIKDNIKICLEQRVNQFCESVLFKELDKEKSDFSFE